MTEGKSPKRSHARIRVVPLPALLVIAQVGELKSTLTDALGAVRPVTLDATAVDQVDSAGMQLLLAFQRAAQAHGCVTQWKNPPPCLQDAAALLGMADALGLKA